MSYDIYSDNFVCVYIILGIYILYKYTCVKINLKYNST